MTKHAFVLRRFTDAGSGQRHPAGSVIEDLGDGHFGNYKAAGLVREATAEEVAAARAGRTPKAEIAPPQHQRSISTPPPPPPEPRPKRVRKPRTATKASGAKTRVRTAK